jgi:hypothetical protein
MQQPDPTILQAAKARRNNPLTHWKNSFFGFFSTLELAMFSSAVRGVE